MSDQSTQDLTDKGRRTRERILDSAVRLFAERGFERTTMRDIAAEARCSLGLAYHYFASKEAIVLGLYARLSSELEAQVRALPPGPLAERFDAALRINLALLTPYRSSMLALFGPALNPESGIAVLGGSTAATRDQVRAAFASVVAGATDAPAGPVAEELATVLYGLHLGTVLVWTQDRSDGTQATEELLRFLRDALALAAPLLELPATLETLARLARIIRPLLA
jgi:AcrR family transcriptional regulator